ncbi:DUF4011 domain-containing protein [Mycoplasma sp. HS2188]|uniref:DUF4011 domain-containing protein n=1 Tax=Mycoplasma sp. HS2188 TaxID=2976765 RepID=UPI0021A991CF|nr:DUF4011 domain-containing protein [Mycoplasma sp. HS2188]MCT4469921.1 DUF4011 domain-containing protein [Mycoplasma sp. HS2188]
MGNRILENIKVWKNDLLDLTFRNKAINYKTSSLSNPSRLQLIAPSMTSILKMLSDKKRGI